MDNNENTNGKTRKPRALAEPGPGPTVTLTAAQVQKLWAIAIGGQITLYTDDNGQIKATVTLGSFAQALPVLIDRL